jgi:hypothetical protein
MKLNTFKDIHNFSQKLPKSVKIVIKLSLVVFSMHNLHDISAFSDFSQKYEDLSF